MRKLWLQKRKGGFYLKSEPSAANGQERRFWIGFMSENGDTHELAITHDIWLFIKRGRKR
jgi:hypothetical protein